MPTPKANSNSGEASVQTPGAGTTPPAAPPELKTDGPTVEEYVKRGYDPRNYPPQGYAPKSSPEEIAKAIEAFDKAKAGSESKPEETAGEKPTAPAQPSLAEEVGKAKKRLGETLQAVRDSLLRDQNVVGVLENAFEDAKNALAGNKVEIAILDAAAKALETGAHALANHSRTAPGVLQAARAAAAAIQTAVGQVK